MLAPNGASLEAFFEPAADGGRRLYLHHTPPHQPVRGAVLQLPAWAEEMNKSRRMAAEASRRMAAAGFAVLQIDLAGCGDASGDLEQADWATWCADALTAARWLRQRHPEAPLWLWGVRAGALLAPPTLDALDGPAHLLLWQPVMQGKAVVQQFLRLKAAAQLADGGGKAILDAARAQLAAGEAVDVAGYRLPPALATGLESAQLAPRPAWQPPARETSAPGAGATPIAPAVAASDIRPPRLVWLETSTAADPALSPAAQAALPRWQAAGWQAHAAVVTGPAFWQTTEIEDAPALWAATLGQLAATDRPHASGCAA